MSSLASSPTTADAAAASAATTTPRPPPTPVADEKTPLLHAGVTGAPHAMVTAISSTGDTGRHRKKQRRKKKKRRSGFWRSPLQGLHGYSSSQKTRRTPPQSTFHGLGPLLPNLVSMFLHLPSYPIALGISIVTLSLVVLGAIMNGYTSVVCEAASRPWAFANNAQCDAAMVNGTNNNVLLAGAYTFADSLCETSVDMQLLTEAANTATCVSPATWRGDTTWQVRQVPAGPHRGDLGSCWPVAQQDMFLAEARSDPKLPAAVWPIQSQWTRQVGYTMISIAAAGLLLFMVGMCTRAPSQQTIKTPGYLRCCRRCRITKAYRKFEEDTRQHHVTIDINQQQAQDAASTATATGKGVAFSSSPSAPDASPPQLPQWLHENSAPSDTYCMGCSKLMPRPRSCRPFFCCVCCRRLDCPGQRRIQRCRMWRLECGVQRCIHVLTGFLPALVTLAWFAVLTHLAAPTCDAASNSTAMGSPHPYYHRLLGAASDRFACAHVHSLRVTPTKLASALPAAASACASATRLVCTFVFQCQEPPSARALDLVGAQLAVWSIVTLGIVSRLASPQAWGALRMSASKKADRFVLRAAYAACIGLSALVLLFSFVNMSQFLRAGIALACATVSSVFILAASYNRWGSSLHADPFMSPPGAIAASSANSDATAADPSPLPPVPVKAATADAVAGPGSGAGAGAGAGAGTSAAVQS